MNPFFRKLSQGRIWERIFRERLAEPLHLNVISLFVLMFGSLSARVYFDLVLRPHNAFGLLTAARLAKRQAKTAITALEFGVANGAGLFNMVEIAQKVSRATGIAIQIVGFDTGTGMPPPLDYRDHPDLYGAGDFPMQNFEALKARLPVNASLMIGNVAETVPKFLQQATVHAPIGYVVIDVDYYSSALAALDVFKGDATAYLPETLIYMDDVDNYQHNPWQGEYLALFEFNESCSNRKICHYNFLRVGRLFKRAQWIDHMFLLHVLDHPNKSTGHTLGQIVLSNPYFSTRSSPRES